MTKRLPFLRNTGRQDSLDEKAAVATIEKALPAITEKMLIQNLKELEADELIIRKAFPIVPPHVEYSLSKSGKELSPVLSSMKKWALKYNV